MKITLATVGRFHIFPLARELERHNHLQTVYSGFPWSRLAREGVSRSKVRTFPWVRPFLLGARHLPFQLPEAWADHLHEFSAVTLDQHIARTLPHSDIYVGHEGVGLISGAAAKQRGMLYVCDRGCTHMAWRERILQEENDRLGLGKRRRPNTYAREIAEYDLADLIVVPSGFVRDSFLAEGIPAEKLAVVPYGVNLERFHPVAQPERNRFDVIFVGRICARKGVKDLLDGFRLAKIPKKHLTLIGTVDPEILEMLGSELSAENVTLRGHMAQSELKHVLSQSHAFCLPSIEEGLALVVAEAMACACPPVVTFNTGAGSLIQDGKNGLIVPIRAPEAIAEAFEKLAASPERREAMAAAALATVKNLGGWESYGQDMIAVYREALTGRNSSLSAEVTR